MDLIEGIKYVAAAAFAIWLVDRVVPRVARALRRVIEPIRTGFDKFLRNMSRR